MDLSKLPENPRTVEERAAALEKVRKVSRELESADRTTFAGQLLALREEQVRALSFSLAAAILIHVSSHGATVYNDSESWVWLKYFFDACDQEAIRWSDEQVEGISRIASDSCAKRGLGPSLQLSGALLVALRKRTSGHWGELTTIHTDLLQVCLVAKLYSLAAQVTDARGTKVCPRRGTASLPSTLALDLQRFFYYSGIAYCAQQRFKDASHAFCECLTLPAGSLGAVHLEAYKKYVLTSLISHGKVLPLPRYTPNAVRTAVSTADKSEPDPIRAYHQLAKAFAKRDQGVELQKVTKEKAAVSDYEASGNAGLVKYVIQAYWKSTVQELTGTYVTMGLADISKAIQQPVDGAELEVLRMILDRDIRARIDQSTGTVRFLSESEDVEEQSKAVRKIEAQIAQVMQVTEEVQALDKRLGTSKDYISKRVLRGGGSGVSPSEDL